jgi:acetyl esterase
MSTTTFASKDLTKTNWLFDEHLAPGVKEFLKIANAPGGIALESLPILAARQSLIDAQKAFKADYYGIDESETEIESEGFRIKLNLVRPMGIVGILPVFIFVHGGGWVLGDYPTHRRLVRDLVVTSGCACAFVNFTPSPEAKYPQAVREIYAAAKWVAEHGKDIGVDGTNLGIVGNSAGGNMSAATAMMAKEKKEPKIKVQILMWPSVDTSFSQPSYERYGEEHFLTIPLMKWSWDQYTTDLAARKEIFASPLNATVEQLRDLPPALIQVAENDILRDEGEAYGRKLLEAGVKATTIRYNGMIHDFGMLNALSNEPATKSLILHAAAELKHYLGQDR